jgi:hypothetical protein
MRELFVVGAALNIKNRAKEWELSQKAHHYVRIQ